MYENISIYILFKNILINYNNFIARIYGIILWDFSIVCERKIQSFVIIEIFARDSKYKYSSFRAFRLSHEPTVIVSRRQWQCS